MRSFNPFAVWSQVALANRTVGAVTGNVTGSVASVTGAVGSVTGAVGSVTGAVGSVTGNVGGQITNFVRSHQIVTVTIGTTTGNYTASMSSVTATKTLLVPLSFSVPQTGNVTASLGNWDFNGPTGVKVDLQTVIAGSTTATAKALVLEYY